MRDVGEIELSSRAAGGCEAGLYRLPVVELGGTGFYLVDATPDLIGPRSRGIRILLVEAPK